MKHRKSIGMMLVLFLVLVLTACAASGEEQGGGRQIIRISHGQPESHPIHIALTEMKAEIESQLGDKYEVQIYANGLLGDTKNVLELAQTGALDFVVGSASNMETFNSLYSIFSMPYLFVSEEAYHDVMADEAITSKIYGSTASSGVISVAWFDAGTRNFYGAQPFKTVDDLKGLKIRVQPSPMNVQMMEAFGAGAVPMGFGEVYTALQNGTIDAAENNEFALTSVKHGEVAKYFSYDRHQMVPDLLIANAAFWNQLPDADKAIFETAVAHAEEVEQREWKIATDEAIQIAHDEMGVEFVEVDTQSFRDRVMPLQQSATAEDPALKEVYDLISQVNQKYEEATK